MSITRKQLKAALAADSRLVSMGILCPQPPPSPDEIPWEEWIKGSAMRASEVMRKRSAQGLDKEHRESLGKTSGLSVWQEHLQSTI